MKTTSISKQMLAKVLAVVVAVAIVLCVAPIAGISEVLLSARAENPVYDSTLGSFTTATDSNGNTVLTAIPNIGAGFRGWYLKDGAEVSYDTSYTVPSGTSASDYIPVFYNFNLVKNGGFEEYANGTNLKTSVPEDEIWNDISDSNDNTSIVVSNDRSRTGENSLRISNAAYKEFYNLDTYTQYTATFYYNIDPSTAATDSALAVNRYLNTVTVIGEDMEMTATANSSDAEYLAQVRYNATTGTCASGEWKEAKVTFYTEANTSVKLLIFYLSQDSAENNVFCNMYIDDVSLVKDVMAEPTYFNEDFSSNTTKNLFVNKNNTSNIAKSNLSIENGRLKVDDALTYGEVQFAHLRLKKGAKYTISFDLDISEVTDIYVPTVNEAGTGYKVDESLISNDNPNGYVWQIHTNGQLSSNWINFSLSDTIENYSSLVIADEHLLNNKTFTATVTNKLGFISFKAKEQSTSSFGFARSTAENKWLNVANLVVKITFTADRDCEAYLNSRLNGRGTYYIDNITVAEDTSGVDYAYTASKVAVESLGTAIRTEGKQGMRYKTQIDKRLLTADKYYGIRLTEYGTVAIKTEYLNDNELVLDGAYDYGEKSYDAKVGTAYSFADKIDFVYAEEQATLDFTGVLMNIAEENWNADYTARAYFKYVDVDGKSGIFYVDPADIAVYPVSKAAYSARNEDGKFTESETVREYLYTNIISKFTDKVIKVSNNSAPTYSNFQGIRSTVYHGVTFFPDSHGRTYTEAQAATEMDRLVDTKVDNVRTRFDSKWAITAYGWDWESEKMMAFYKWAEMLQDRDISITLQAGWHLHDFIYYYDKWVATNPVGYKEADAKGHSSIPEVNYLHGYSDANTKVSDFYGEDANAAVIEATGRSLGLNLTDEEYAHYSVVAARYAEWIKQGLNSLKAHGINNVEYVLPFTESGSLRNDDPTWGYDEWMLMTVALNDALEKEGTRQNYKFIGPAQSIYAFQNRYPFIEYIYSLISDTEYEDLLDITAMHQYTAPNTQAGYDNTVFEPYASHSLAKENFSYYNDVLVNAGVRNMEFWCDEYFARIDDAKWWDDVGMQMTQFAAGLTAGINIGVNRFLTWQMFDTLWDSDVAHGAAILDNNGEFSGGVHVVGTCPSLVHVDGKACPNGDSCDCTKYYPISSYIPRKTYYGINLIGKYMNCDSADVYNTEVIDEATKDGGGVYVSAIKNDNGKTVILVVNTMPTVSSFDIELEKENILEFKRYTYDPNEVVPTAEAKSLPSDKTITLNGATTFHDVIPAQSFAIYVENGTYFGGTIDIPMGDIFELE